MPLYLGDIPDNEYTTTIKDVSNIVLPLIENDDGWNFQNETHGVKSFTRITKQSPVPAIRAVCTIQNATVEEFRAVFAPTTLRKEYDKQFMFSERIESINPLMEIRRSCFAAPWPISNRDFVVLDMFIPMEDGKLLLIGASVEHPKCQPDPKFVRGTMYYMGWLVTPLNNAAKIIPNDNQQEEEQQQQNQKIEIPIIDVTFLCLSTPNGSIPNWIIASTVSNIIDGFIGAKLKLESKEELNKKRSTNNNINNTHNTIDGNNQQQEKTFVERCVEIMHQDDKKILDLFINKNNNNAQQQK